MLHSLRKTLKIFLILLFFLLILNRKCIPSIFEVSNYVFPNFTIASICNFANFSHLIYRNAIFFFKKIKLVLITLHRLKNNFHFRSLEQDFGFKIQVVEKVGNTKLAKAKLYIFFFLDWGRGQRAC